MSKQIYHIIILGPPGSGKGTQADLLAEKLDIPNISTGQLLREEINKKSKYGQQIEQEMKTGDLISNAIVNQLVKQKLSQPECQNGFIFDGFPRIKIQAKILDTLTYITQVLEIAVSDNEVKKRLSGRRTCSKCGNVYHLEFNPPKKQYICDECGGQLEIRDDDTSEGIRRRLEIYHQETEEVIEYYKQKELVIKINGEQSIEDVKKEIFSYF